MMYIFMYVWPHVLCTHVCLYIHVCSLGTRAQTTVILDYKPTKGKHIFKPIISKLEVPGYLYSESDCRITNYNERRQNDNGIMIQV